MKIWIVYDSKFGNNKQIAQVLGDTFKSNYEVHVYHVKEISPRHVANERPDLFLFGGPRRIGRISFTLQRWIKRFARILRSRNMRITHVGAWETHILFKEADLHPESKMEQNIIQANLNTGSKWIELIQKIPAELPPPDLLSLTVEKQEGPLESGAMGKVAEFATKFR